MGFKIPNFYAQQKQHAFAKGKEASSVPSPLNDLSKDHPDAPKDHKHGNMTKHLAKKKPVVKKKIGLELVASSKKGSSIDDNKKPALPKKAPKKIKVETEGKDNQGATEYIRGGREGDKNTRSVEVSKDFAGDNRKTVRRKKKDGTIKTTSRKISDKRAARIKKRKDKKFKEQ